ncbi:helicase-associated domain-containing protein [Streptomyces albiaxialis]|uniref:Helicase-associated domain-containing protein n=1 Tax=Streptomyces albiaxialis TaxID=329523 RepID=A0ABN2VGU1_9ACTN
MSSEQNGRTPPRQAGPSAPRTLAEDLRAREDAALADLLRTRPDLLSPVPGDLTQLATRAGTRASVARALERLDQFTLQTAQALALLPSPGSPTGPAGPPPDEALGALLPGDEAAAQLPYALRRLREQALVWGGEGQPRLVRTARELLTSPSPTGLGPTLAEAANTAKLSPARLQEILAAAGLPATHDPVSALAALTSLFTDRTRTAALLDEAPDGAEALLRKLEWGPPYGTADTDAPSPPVAWLLDRALLVPAGPGEPGKVVLPREVALHLRGGHAHRVLEPVPPPVAVARAYEPGTVDATAAGQALAALAAVEELLAAWEAEPPPVLRAGGLGVRDLKRAALTLDVPEPTAAFWAELAYGAGLLASDGEADETYAPTPAYDDWLRLPPAERWTRLVTPWLTATRVAGLVGERDAKGRALSALGPGLDRGLAPEIRGRTLALLAELADGTAGGTPGAAPDPATVRERMRWERPLRGQDVPPPHDLRSRLVSWTLTEAESLGLTGRGSLASHARPLLADEQKAAQAALSPLLPPPLDHVLLQADLTAVAPGPLERELATALGILADVESKGGATVYRFTPGSVRRALDSGQTAADLHAFLTAHSHTPVPQPLTYLIDDVARKHGVLRVGAASSYVRCDDDALLAELLADKRSAPLRLRLLAPTVLASPAPPDQLLARLREMGYAPAAESSDGDVLLSRPDAHRTPPRAAPDPVPDGPPLPDRTLLTAAVRAIRAGDHAATLPHRPPRPDTAPNGDLPRTVMAETLATMQSATLTGTPLWIGYVNADGAASQRVIAPVKVEGGFVTAYDHTADEVRTYPLHRITGVAEVPED